MLRCLVIENDEHSRVVLTRLLVNAGYDVVSAKSAEEGLSAAGAENFDLIILELILPDVSGEHVLHVLAATKPWARVMVVSSVDEVGRRVGSLHMGAVDFVAKPFANAELLARIRVHLRGHTDASVSPSNRLLSGATVETSEFAPLDAHPFDSRSRGDARGTEVWSVEEPARVRELALVGTASQRDPQQVDVRSQNASPLTAWQQTTSRSAVARPMTTDVTVRVYDPKLGLDIRRRALVAGGRTIQLSQREFGLMSHFLHRRGQVCTRQDLLADVWGLDLDPGTNIVDVYVGRLRRKLPIGSIESVYRVGYRLVAS
jgi:DNA-binding response OmpR family regulator